MQKQMECPVFGAPPPAALGPGRGAGWVHYHEREVMAGLESAPSGAAGHAFTKERILGLLIAS